ncbi:unnamed protein product [Pelagomonas calceolata]|uniref:Uncharacterized protein n=1 Tax=Pelagomonas calceolata TaxID=35677 RepID=A0A8J2T270_9STRA|nr:unnamed protein product [Pelagomonas calceolata]
MQQKLETTLNSSANVEYALRYATMALNFLVREVLLYLAPDAAPLDQLATVESTKKGAFCDSYDQIGLLHELALIFSRFPTKMQKRGGLGAVHRALRGGRASPPPPTSAASLSSVGTTPSATIAAADSSSVTVATLSSARDATMEPVCPPLPPVPPTSSSLGGTLPSTESVAPSSSLTNNVKPTSDTAASTKAYPSEGALADLRRRLASRENKDNSLGATAMVVDEKSSAPDPQVLAELIENYSFDLPDGSEALTKKDIKIGDVLYTVPINNGSMPLCRVEKISGGYVHVKDSTNNGGGKASKPRPGMLRRASRDDVNRFPPKDGPLTEAPLLATPPPPISLPPNDIITKVVDGLRCLLLERDLRFGGYGDKERRRMQSPVETVSDALDLLQFVVCTLDGALSAIDGDRKRTIGQKSLDTFNREVRPLVLFESLRSLLKEWAKVPEHVRPPFLTTPVAQASNDSILTKPRDRKTTERLADDLDAQKSSYCARYAVRPETEASCANCGVAFTYTGHEHRWKCSKDDCKKVFCGECAGLASQQPLNSKWVCRLCKSSEPIDVVKPTQTSGSLIHGSKIRLLVTGRIRLALGDDYEPYCKYMGPKFGSKAWYDLEVFTGAYEGEAACRRFTKSTEGTASILIDWKGNGVFAVFDEFWDYCREPGETPLQVAERMTVEVHPGFEVIAGLFRWGVLDYLDGAKGGFVGGWRMQKLRDDHGVGQSSMPTVSDFLALPYQECLEHLNDPEWPTPELKDMFCEYGAEEARRLASSGPDVPPARQPAQGPGSRNHALETPAVIVADRADRDVRERATLEFLLAFKAGRLHDPAMQVIDGLHRISGWLSIACADGNLGADQHIKQQTPLYLAAVRVRELMGESETRGPFIRSPLNNFLCTGAGDGSDLDKLRHHWNVFMGASWRARYRETPTSEYKYVELTAVWEKHDPAARAAGPEALPAPSFRAPRSRN